MPKSGCSKWYTEMRSWCPCCWSVDWLLQFLAVRSLHSLLCKFATHWLKDARIYLLLNLYKMQCIIYHSSASAFFFRCVWFTFGPCRSPTLNQIDISIDTQPLRLFMCVLETLDDNSQNDWHSVRRARRRGCIFLILWLLNLYAEWPTFVDCVERKQAVRWSLSRGRQWLSESAAELSTQVQSLVHMIRQHKADSFSIHGVAEIHVAT